VAVVMVVVVRACVCVRVCVCVCVWGGGAGRPAPPPPPTAGGARVAHRNGSVGGLASCALHEFHSFGQSSCVAVHSRLFSLNPFNHTIFTINLLGGVNEPVQEGCGVSVLEPVVHMSRKGVG
jgi:hypothetical protein